MGLLLTTLEVSLKVADTMDALTGFGFGASSMLQVPWTTRLPILPSRFSLAVLSLFLDRRVYVLVLSTR
jgi:hypothetical protein